ncbi:MAG TPA: hypothetical protein VMZ50_12470, partial [Phycisphaerae bacterium]|nr:hypothetical protein [Phycisphaerae bacterium]
MRRQLLQTAAIAAAFCGCTAAGLGGGPKLQQADHGAVVETERYRATIRRGVLTSFVNKLTAEEYLDPLADLDRVLPHLPSGMGTQTPEAARKAAQILYTIYPWNSAAADRYLPNHHYPAADSKLTAARAGERAMVLTYQGLTDGRKRYDDESYSLRVEVDAKTGDLLLTPSAESPRPGVYGAVLTVPPLAPGITAEAPIMDGVRLTADMPHHLAYAEWASSWDYAFMALNGRKTGAVGIWAQDAEMKYYKHLFFLVNREGLSFSMNTMNVPPFEKLTRATGMTWRVQAFDRSWAQAAARFRAWRAEKIKFAPRPEWTRRVSLVNGGVNANKLWLDVLRAFFGGHGLDRTVTFAPVIRGRPFDRAHWDNIPYKGFKDDMPAWKESGAKLMAYLQPMIMWGGATPTEEDKKVIALAEQARTHSVFQD